MKFRLNPSVLTATLLCLTGAAHAQSSPTPIRIVYAAAGSTSSVPTLGEWGLIVTLLAVVAFGARRLRPAHRLLSTLMVLGCAMAAIPGGGLSRAYALLLDGGTLTSESGGYVDVQVDYEIDTSVTNATQVALRIVSVSPDSYETDSLPTCAAGLVLQPTESCYLKAINN